jgi:hypothetical protein
MDLCAPVTPLGIGKVRSEPDVQPWACDQLALASGQVYYQQNSGNCFFLSIIIKVYGIYISI